MNVGPSSGTSWEVRRRVKSVLKTDNSQPEIGLLDLRRTRANAYLGVGLRPQIEGTLGDRCMGEVVGERKDVDRSPTATEVLINVSEPEI